MTKQISEAFGKKIFLIGKLDGQKIWLEEPSWDCSWYWGFGYLKIYTHKNPKLAKDSILHTHVNMLLNESNTCNIYDIKGLTDQTFTSKQAWELSELFEQFYLMKKTCEFFGRGKCHIAETTCENFKNTDISTDINTRIIPAITERILEILSPTIL